MLIITSFMKEKTRRTIGCSRGRVIAFRVHRYLSRGPAEPGRYLPSSLGFFGRLAGGRSASARDAATGKFATQHAPTHSDNVRPSFFAAASNAAHQSAGCVRLRRSLVMVLSSPDIAMMHLQSIPSCGPNTAHCTCVPVVAVAFTTRHICDRCKCQNHPVDIWIIGA